MVLLRQKTVSEEFQNSSRECRVPGANLAGKPLATWSVKTRVTIILAARRRAGAIGLVMIPIVQSTSADAVQEGV